METKTLSDRLAALKNYATRYEVAATHPDGRRLLVVYTPRKSRRGILAFNPNTARALVAVCGADSFTKGKGGAILIGEWTVDFTGRTQREALTVGELPFVQDVAPAVAR